MFPTSIFIAYKKTQHFFFIGCCRNSYISLFAGCCCRDQQLLGAVGEQNKCAIQTNSSCWTGTHHMKHSVTIASNHCGYCPALAERKESVAHKNLFLAKAVDYCCWTILLWFAWLLCSPFVLHLIFAFRVSGQQISQTLSCNLYLKCKWISSTGRTFIFTEYFYYWAAKTTMSGISLSLFIFSPSCNYFCAIWLAYIHMWINSEGTP